MFRGVDILVDISLRKVFIAVRRELYRQRTLVPKRQIWGLTEYDIHTGLPALGLDNCELRG